MRDLPHLPWAPLGRVLAVFEIDRTAVGTSVNRIAAITGVDRRQLARYQQVGWITLHAGEAICDTVGVHPAEVWDDYGLVADAAVAGQSRHRASRDRHTEMQGTNA